MPAEKEESVKVSYRFDDKLQIEAKNEDVVTVLAEAKLDVVQIRAVSENLFSYRPTSISQTEIIETVSRLGLLAEDLREKCSTFFSLVFQEGEN